MLLRVESSRALAIIRDVKAVLLVILLRNWTVVATLLFLNLAGNIVLAALSASIFIQLFWNWNWGNNEHESTPELNTGPKVELASFARALILPCQTTHTRLFPTKHSFAYSYLYVGIPVRWKGPAGNVLRTRSGKEGSPRRRSSWTWFAIEAEDYLERGSHPDGLQGKLREYLSSQGVKDDRYPHAFLVTAPRFLGYSFNPVSFWYLYSREKKLEAMILEVNNTFDERRMYFMRSGRYEGNQRETDGVFHHVWDKDFHVSPFNDREGAYSLSALDLFDANNPGKAKLDNTIVLKSGDGKPKVIARVYSTEPALEAATMTRLQTLSFVAKWWWVGFMTNPRILREARILWVKKLQVFYRPEVFNTTIGRNETTDERDLEIAFRRFLLQLVHEYHVKICYHAAAGSMRAKADILASAAQGGQDRRAEMELRVITPAFYGQLARSPTIMDAFEHCFFHGGKGGTMLHISQPTDFKEMLDHLNVPQNPGGPLNLKWRVLALLRKYIQNNKSGAFQSKSVMIGLPPSSVQHSLSELDRLLLHNSTPIEANKYCQAAIRVLLADTFAFGFTSILDFSVGVMWLAYIYTASVLVQGFLAASFGAYQKLVLWAGLALPVLQFLA